MGIIVLNSERLLDSFPASIPFKGEVRSLLVSGGYVSALSNLSVKTSGESPGEIPWRFCGTHYSASGLVFNILMGTLKTMMNPEYHEDATGSSVKNSMN